GTGRVRVADERCAAVQAARVGSSDSLPGFTYRTLQPSESARRRTNPLVFPDFSRMMEVDVPAGARRWGVRTVFKERVAGCQFLSWPWRPRCRSGRSIR